MTLIRIASLVGVCSLLTSLAAAQQAPPPQQPPPVPGVPAPGVPTPGGPGSPVTGTGICTIRGQVLGPSDFGVAAGLPVADSSAVLLDDGRVRLYAFAQGIGVVSALSVGPDGLTFVPEQGVRIGGAAGMPRVVKVPGGGLRAFIISGGGIQSALSTDGLTFTAEPGYRMTAEAAGFSDTTVSQTSGATVVPLADGRFRMYFSDLPRPGDPPGNHRVKSAVSSDMLAWTVEDGVRLGPGAPVLADSAEHPFALANPDGSVTLYYGKFNGPGSSVPEGTYQSTSSDGLTFEQETMDVYFGNDPDALRLTDGTLALYFGQFDHERGGTVNVAHCPDPASATAAPGRVRRTR